MKIQSGIQSYNPRRNEYQGFNYNSKKPQKDEVSFSGAAAVIKYPYTKLTEGLAYVFGWTTGTRPMQGLVNKMQNTSNIARHIAAFVGVTLSCFYMKDTAKSKTIKKDDKLPLIINQGSVCALSTAGAYTIDKYLDKKLANFTDNFHISSMSDPEHKKIFLQLKEDSSNIELLEEAAGKLKSPKQIFNQRLLDVIDNPEKYQELIKSGDFQKDEYARKLVKQLEAEANPKQFLQNNVNSSAEFLKELKENFKFDAKLLKKLDKMEKKGEADDIVKTLLQNVKNISKKEADRIGKASEFFMNQLKNSKILQKEFCKQSFNNAINMIAQNDEKLKLNQKGFKFGKSIMIFAMIYRFVAPVIATPIANSLSDKITADKKANDAKAAKTPQKAA